MLSKTDKNLHLWANLFFATEEFVDQLGLWCPDQELIDYCDDVREVATRMVTPGDTKPMAKLSEWFITSVEDLLELWHIAYGSICTLEARKVEKALEAIGSGNAALVWEGL